MTKQERIPHFDPIKRDKTAKNHPFLKDKHNLIFD